MAANLRELAILVEGRLIGDGTIEIMGVASLDDAGPGDLTLADRNEKAEQLANTRAQAAVIPLGFDASRLTMPAIEVADVHKAFTKIVLHLRPRREKAPLGISPRAIVSPSARIGADVDIHPGATVGDDVEIGPGCVIHGGVQIMDGCKLGPSVTLYPHVVLYEGTQIGAECIVHSNAVIGSHGFGYRFANGRHELSAQMGHVEIGPRVEIGACTTIDRGTYGPTQIGEGTKIDNLVMIAHNCRIGRHNLICSQVGIAGSTSTGDHVVMAGQVGVRDHVHIGDRAVLAAKSGVANDVKPDERMLGIPACPEREQKLRMAGIAKLSDLRKRVANLERQLAGLSGGDDSHRNQAA